MFRNARDEKEVSVTVRQLAKSRNMSKSSVERAIDILVKDRAIVVVSVGAFEGKRKPSSYRLTAYPCRGKPPTHDYIENTREWRRATTHKRSKAAKSARFIFEVPAEQVAAAMAKVDGFLEPS
jgi:hypothetical protein